MRAHWKSFALAGALLVAPALSRAVPALPPVNVESMSFDINALWKIYNSAKQTNGTITEWPKELADQAGVVVAQVKNTDPNNSITPYFRVSIAETSANCANSEVAYGPILQLKDPLGPGELRTLNAASFTLASGGANGQFCQAFEDDIKSKLEGVDASKIQDAINLFNTKNFLVCLQQCMGATDGTPYPGAVRGCTSLKLFSANNVVNQTIVAMLIYPHNNNVPNPYPNFVWAPAILSAELGHTDVWYTLEITEQGQEAPYASIDIDQPNAQFYQYKGSDKALVPGKSYCWKVISQVKIGGVKKPVGANGRGWNIVKCFTVDGKADAACHYTKEDLDKWLQENGEPGIKEKLKGQTIKNILDVTNDPVICRLLAGQVHFTSIKVVKQ